MEQKESLLLRISPEKARAVCLQALKENEWEPGETAPAEIFATRKGLWTGDVFVLLKIKVLKRGTGINVIVWNEVMTWDPLGVLSKPMDELCVTIDRLHEEQIAAEETAIESTGPATKDLFISYSTEDVRFAHRIAGDLKLHGLTVWIDKEGISAGTDWADRIAEAILSARVLLLVLSPHSMTSDWVKNELSFAKRNRKAVLPVIHKLTAFPPWFELEFGRVQRADFSTGKYKDKLEVLVEEAKALLIPRKSSAPS